MLQILLIRSQCLVKGSGVAQQRAFGTKVPHFATGTPWMARRPELRRSTSISATLRPEQESSSTSTPPDDHTGIVVKIFADKDYEQEAFKKANQSAGHGFHLQHLRVRSALAPVSWALIETHNCELLRTHHELMLQISGTRDTQGQWSSKVLHCTSSAHLSEFFWTAPSSCNALHRMAADFRIPAVM